MRSWVTLKTVGEVVVAFSLLLLQIYGFVPAMCKNPHMSCPGWTFGIGIVLWHLCLYVGMIVFDVSQKSRLSISICILMVALLLILPPVS
jgi:hypothetical protein